MHRNHVYIRRQIDQIADDLKGVINYTRVCPPHLTRCAAEGPMTDVQISVANIITALATIHTLDAQGNIRGK